MSSVIQGWIFEQKISESNCCMAELRRLSVSETGWVCSQCGAVCKAIRKEKNGEGKNTQASR